MSLQVTTLVENTQGEHLALINEHGISFYIEKDGHKLLFDTGQSDAFLYNADQMKIDLSDLEYVILSHGHYDHSGGLIHLMEMTSSYKVIMGTGFFNEKFGYRNNSYEFLGNNFDEDFLTDNDIDYRFVKDDLTELIPGVYVITNFPRKHGNEVINPRFKILKDGKFEQDMFNDEVMVTIDTPKGLVVILGCSHPGMRNMLDAAKSLLNKPIYAVLGGTHLVEAQGEMFDMSIDYLNSEGIEVVGVSHCTGQQAMETLSASNERYFHNRTGSSLYVM